MNLNIVIFGLSITSSWGNGHATTYRSLIKALARRGHRITFIERDVPWYREHRDLHDPNYCRVELYERLEDVRRRFAAKVRTADLVILGSYVPDGIAIGNWILSHVEGVTAFYDIDTPVTLSKMQKEGTSYITAGMIPRFDLYLSFTGGPTLREIEELYGSPRARALYCAAEVPPNLMPATEKKWALGYLGTYSRDREKSVNELLVVPASRLAPEKFVVAGAQYPAGHPWPANVDRIDHVAPAQHRSFYASQRFTLNVTRADMIRRGYSPSVRLFEAAASGAPIISDWWSGIETFLRPGEEILIAEEAHHVMDILVSMSDERRRSIAAAAQNRLARFHSAEHRAKDLEQYYQEVTHDLALRRRKICGVAMQRLTS